MATRMSEEDYAVLRKPLESGRQSPSSIGGHLVLAVFGQGLFLFLEYYIAKFTKYPNHAGILEIHFWATVVLVLLSLMYAIPAVYRSSQKIQYFLSILVIQNIGAVSMFILVLFMMGTEDAIIMSGSLDTFMLIALLFGLFVFLLTCVRFWLLLRKGAYRRGSDQDRIRSRFETKSYVPIAIVGGIALFFVAQYIFRNLGMPDIDMAVMLTLMMLIVYVMLFVLPEQLVILYCKLRFKSFNYTKDGKLCGDESL